MKITRVAAYGLITDGERLLLCRIAEPGNPDRGKWTLPGGGLEFGESPEAGVVREVAEETGFMVKPTGLAHVDSWMGAVGETKYHHVCILYHAQIIGGELRHELQGSTDRCEWWRHDDRPPLWNLAAMGFRLAFG